MTGTPPAAEAPTALLIAPLAFYSFARQLAGGLEARGYKVIIANDEYPSNVVGKVLGKLRVPFFLPWMTQRVLGDRFLNGKTYTLALVVKGRGLSPKLVERLKRHADRVIGYNFDSFSFNPAPLPWIHLVDKYCTFDFADAERHDLPRVDLFSSLPTGESKPERRYLLSAILRNHSDRLKYLHRAMAALPTGEKLIYIYENSLITLVLNCLKNPFLYWTYRRSIHTTSLPYADYVSILRDSVFTLDFAHPKQTGITIRCFEAASAGTKIITNNPHTLRHPFFDAGNTLVVGIAEPAATLPARLTEVSPGMPAPRMRSMSDFLDDLLHQAATDPTE